MIRSSKHCRHCGVPYWCYASGGSHHDERWCPECFAEARAAVAKRPILFEDAFIPSTEVTLAELLAEESLTLAAGKPRRIFMGLMSADDSQNVRLIRIKGKGDFRLTTWVKNPDFSIEKLVRWDVQKNCEASNTRSWPS